MIETMKFDATPTEIPVIIGADNYVIREASGDAGVKYRNAMFSGAEIGEGGKAKFNKLGVLANIEPLLVSLCTFKKEGDKFISVPETTVRSWPDKVVKALYKKIKEISELDDQGGEGKESFPPQDDAPKA